MNQYTSLLSRILFVGAFIAAALAVLERLANVFGYTTFIRGVYEPGRVLEFSGIALLFVIALLLRDIKYSLATKTRT